MTFRLADPAQAYPVTVRVDVPGAAAPHHCRLLFRLIGDNSDIDIDKVLEEGDKELLRRGVAGWEDIRDHDGEELPFSEANLARLSGIPYFRRCAIAGYLRFVTGLPEKNSPALP